MKKNSQKINRRTFLGTTGTIVAGLSLLPETLLAANGAVSITGHEPETGRAAVSPAEEKWWEKEPLRIVEFEEGYQFSEKFELLKGLGANMEHATRFTDTSPGTSFLDAHSLFGGRKVNFGSLKEYIREARKRNIRVVIYYNVHAIEIGYARQHPDWQQIKDDGKPIEDVYSVDSSFCINSPWREEVFHTLKKIAAFEIDGIFYDGPIFFSATCHCESCKRLFREKYQKELPSKGELSSTHQSPQWKEFIEFQSDSIAAFLRESNRILKEANPQILFYMNGNTLAPSWPTARDNRKIIRETDILGAEGGFLYGELKEPVYKPGAVAKLLETQSGGKPTVVFDAAKQGPWSFSTLPRGEMSLLFSQTITSQANVWLAISAVSNLHDQELDVIKKYNRFIMQNPDPFFKTKSAAKIALLWPQAAGNYYSGSSVPLTDFTHEIRGEKAGNIEEEFYGFYDGLSRCHFPFDVLDEAALSNDLSRYDLLILPNATCLNNDETGNLRKYVMNGGNLISTFETSQYDETGNKLENFGLHDVFGIESSGDIFGPLDWDYIARNNNSHFTIREIKNKYLNAPSYGIKTKTKIKVPLIFCKPLPGSYSGSPEISAVPFLVENSFGKGRSIYIAGTFGASLNKYHFPEYYQILTNLVGEFSKPLVTLGNAPSSVEVNVRKKDSSIFIYLINFTSEMKRPIQRIITCTDIRITVHSDVPVKSLRSLWQDRTFEFSRDGNSISFTLPSLEEYEVLKLEI